MGDFAEQPVLPIMHFQQTSTVRRPLRILCAEDNALLGEIIVRLLQSRGHWIEHVLDGVEAWSRVELNLTRHDVVVTDQEMPGLNGLEFVARWSDPATLAVLWFIFPASPTRRLGRYRSLGVHAIIGKSSRAENLIAAVEAVAGVEQTYIPSWLRETAADRKRSASLRFLRGADVAPQ